MITISISSYNYYSIDIMMFMAAAGGLIVKNTVSRYYTGNQGSGWKKGISRVNLYKLDQLAHVFLYGVTSQSMLNRLIPLQTLSM